MTFDRLFISFLVREEFNLTKFEEILEQQRRQCVDKGLNLPFHGRTEMDTADVKILKIKEHEKVQDVFSRMMKTLMMPKKKVKEVNQKMKWTHNKVLDHQELQLVYLRQYMILKYSDLFFSK
jgi:hypothetical protein